MKPPKNEIVQPPKVLTIAGSDSGGAAGLQADLKTFTALGVYGMSAVTAVTAQNSEEIQIVHPVPDDVVARQIDAVLSDYGADAVKTGFIGRVNTIKKIAETGSVILMSHLGRPKGKEDKFSLKHIVSKLSELLGKDVGSGYLG